MLARSWHDFCITDAMPVEMTSLATHRRQQTENAGPDLGGIRSVQKQTVRYDDVSFNDVLGAFNPLNHIPGVSSVFATGEGTNPVTPLAQLVGGGLLGGVVGFVGAAVNLIFQEATGKTLIGSIASAVMEDEPRVALAQTKIARYQQVVQAPKSDAKHVVYS